MSPFEHPNHYNGPNDTEPIQARKDFHNAGSVLVVDDDTNILKLSREALNVYGFNVTIAKDGITALELCEKTPFDTVFADIFMPRMGGIELLRNLKNSFPATPVIVISAMPSLQTAVEALRAGAFDYLVKPIRPSLIAETAHRAIAAKRNHEQQAKEKQRLESIAEANNLMENIGFVFAGIRHELGNPVNALKMTLSVMKENLDTFSKERIHSFVTRALEDLGRIEYLLSMLRSYNMFERVFLQKQELHDFMKKFESLVSHDLVKRGIDARFYVSEDIGAAHTDPRALQQILLNLVTNAMDACEGVEKPRIEIGVTKKNDVIVFTVRDNGCGIPVEDRENIFKPFFSKKPSGTGLGLAIVKKMLAKMNGTIQIISNEGSGTTVAVTIPARYDRAR